MPEEPLASRLKTASTPIPDSFFSTLITANHILHNHGIVDGYGHISCRSPQDATQFYISASIAPALVSSKSDLHAYHVADATPVDPSSPKGYLERFIHSELYKAYPDVQAVVHAHAEAVLPFGITSVPLRPVFHMGGVMGSVVPVYDVEQHYSSYDTRHDLLIGTQGLGGTLAAGFGGSSSVLKQAGSAAGSMIRSFVGGKEERVKYPPHSVVLMRGHGFTAVGLSVEEVVYRCVYTVVNAKVQRDAVLMQGAWNTGVVGARVGKVGKEGYEGGDKEGSTRVEGVKMLSERESKDAWESNKGQASRPWKLWVEEVKHSGLYRNEFWEKEDEEEQE